MGTEVHYKNSFPRYYSMRNVNEDSSSGSWALFYGDNAWTNGHYYNGFTSRTVPDSYVGYEKDELKQKMLQHEAIFKNQVYELHRLYRRQLDMMEEAKRKDFHKYQIPIDTSSSSNLFPPQNPNKDAHKWHVPRPSIFGPEISNSPLSCSKANGSKDCEVIDCRPLKVRKKLFDLQLPADEYVEPVEIEEIQDNQASEISSYPSKDKGFGLKNGVKKFLDGQHFMGSNGLADLDEPVYDQEAIGIGDPPQPINFLGPFVKRPGFNHFAGDDKWNGRDTYSYMRETGNNIRSNMNFTSRCFESNKLHSHFNQNPMLFANNRISSPYPSSITSDIGTSWSKPNDGLTLTHKLTTHLSPSTHEVFGNKWHRMNIGFGSNPPAQNGFYRGSSSRSKELSARFDYRNGKKIDDASRKIFKGSNFIDLTEPESMNGMDLNCAVQDLTNEDDDSRKRDESKEKDELLAKNKKLMGFPIFGDSCVSKTDALCVSSTSVSVERRAIDINVAWDDAMDSDHIEKGIDLESGNDFKTFKNHFDLNSCVTEDEDLLVLEPVKSSKKPTMEIDLEAPAVSEEEPPIDQKPELENVAVEAIVAISGHVGPTCMSDDDYDRLLWFVEVVTGGKNTGPTVDREIDEYEMLTLRLEETKAEYMRVRTVPEPSGEAGPAGGSCPRRGQTRRGRPRRDFQRDILPGMVSLSRHEITEDLQVFGGLMRAMGHSWNVGSRRSGKRSGVRRVKAVAVAVAETPPAAAVLPPVVVGLEERKLTGWGKTTRRPRRQRFAAGNSVAGPADVI